MPRTHKPEETTEEEGTATPDSTKSPDQESLRKRLPYKMVSHSMSLWELLKATIGKDMTRICMPLEIFEPLGLLQVYCEELEYSELLDKANKEDDPYQRMALVTAFGVSRYASTRKRGQGKPFNPLEGETYEYVRNDLGWRFIAEQVSHHPGISACHAEGRGWTVTQSAAFDLSFWGTYLQAKPTSTVDVILSNHKESYRWNKVVSTVHNLFSGTKYLDHHGDMKVKCSSGLVASLHFKKKTHVIGGNIVDDKTRVHKFTGKWSEFLNLDDTQIWTAHPLPPHAKEQYGFTDFAVTLNDMVPSMVDFLPPTDTRFRPDQRLLEEENLEEGKVHKLRLENDQRARRKMRKYKPKWFSYSDKSSGNKSKGNGYVFTKRYWEARKRHFSGEQFDKLW